jgi:hypothetical protein
MTCHDVCTAPGRPAPPACLQCAGARIAADAPRDLGRGVEAWGAGTRAWPLSTRAAEVPAAAPRPRLALKPSRQPLETRETLLKETKHLRAVAG